MLRLVIYVLSHPKIAPAGTPEAGLAQQALVWAEGADGVLTASSHKEKFKMQPISICKDMK